MIFTDQLQLPCPEDTDYALLPYYMQRVAEQIESLIVAQRAELALFENQPTAIWRSSGGPYTFATTGFLSTNLTANDVAFTNYRCSSPSGLQLPEFAESTTVMFPSPGIYHLGFHVINMNCAAVTNDSNRIVQLQVQKLTATGYQAVEQWGRRVNAETTQLADYFSAELVCLVDQDFARTSCAGGITHANAAGNMTVPIGGMTAWLTRIGSTDLIEVT